MRKNTVRPTQDSSKFVKLFQRLVRYSIEYGYGISLDFFHNNKEIIKLGIGETHRWHFFLIFNAFTFLRVG